MYLPLTLCSIFLFSSQNVEYFVWVFYKNEIYFRIQENYQQGATILGYDIWPVLVRPSGNIYFPSDSRKRLCSMDLFT